MDDDGLDPQSVLWAYTQGTFPMARDGDASTVHWYTANPRALLPLDDRFTVRRSLARVVRSRRFSLTRDRAFAHVIDACAEPRPNETGTWINEPIRRAFIQLHEMGFAHSVEAWLERDDGKELQLAGGLYGVAIGAAFFGESMFSRTAYASQVALVHLVEHLRVQQFQLLDVQFINPHLEQFGVFTMPADRYMAQLQQAINQHPCW